MIYCEFIIIRVLPNFVDFVHSIQPKILRIKQIFVTIHNVLPNVGIHESKYSAKTCNNYR